MRQRFTEINIIQSGQNNNETIPVGCQAKNVTLSDGSILQQALGNINYQKNGSLVKQINSLKSNTNREFAPLQDPRFKNTIAVRRYFSNTDILSEIQPANSSNAEESRGITATYSNGVWTFNGTITSGDNSVCILYGDNNYTYQIAGKGDYSVLITTNNEALRNSVTGLEFFWHNSTNNENENIIIQAGNSESSFTIRENYYLCRISLYMYASEGGVNLTNTTLQFSLIKTDEISTEDKENVVFYVGKNLSTNSWKTTIAENLVVDKGLQSEAKSSLGNIYNSSWTGMLEINQEENKNGLNSTGIIIPDGAISFPIKDYSYYENNRNNLFNKTRDIRNGRYYIGSDFDTSLSVPLPHLAYSSPGHRFWISGDGSPAETEVYIKRGTTTINNTLVANTVKSNVIAQYKFFNTRKDLENFITQDTTVNNYQPILFATSPNMAYFLTSGKIATNTVDTDRVYGIGFKFYDNSDRQFYGLFMAKNLWRFSYTWKNSTNNQRQLISKGLTSGGTANPDVDKNYSAPNGTSGW